MLSKKNKIFIFSIFSIFFITFLLRYLNDSDSKRYLKNIYFNLPIFFSNKKICKNYDLITKKYIDETISFSVMDNNGNIISESNSEIARIPASNLKLLSTAYVFSKYDNFDSLKTEIYKDNKSNYYIEGSGDPDLSLNDIKELLKNIEYNDIININLIEINKDIYWPEGWTIQDKFYKYGSAITKLAIKSNSSRYLDINGLKTFIYDYLLSKFPNSKINIYINNNLNNFKKRRILIDNVNSNPILSLVTLANSESHNFTTESLFKNASGSWNDNSYKKLYFWLKNRGLPTRIIYIADASGLSRNNKVTTKLLASFLHKMKFNYNYESYASTLSIIGIRGTLSNSPANNELKGKFLGKTGTLSNVFALSGYLFKEDKIYSVSIIQNSNFIDKNKIFNLLNDIYGIDKCY